MAKVMVLTDQTTGRRVVVRGNTQIGRLSFHERGMWKVRGRNKPKVFDSLDTLVCVSEVNKVVSRNHAALIQGVDGEFHIEDMNSKHGTYVNGDNINPSKSDSRSVLLRERDALQIGRRTRGIDDCFLNFEISYQESENYALLVGTGSDNLGAAQRGLDSLERVLRRRGYVVRVLPEEEASKSRLREELRNIANMSIAESHNIISIYGHGSHNGFMLGGQVMNAREFYKEVGRIAGKKAALLEFCYSGSFVRGRNLGRIPDGTLVLTASNAFSEANETEDYVEGQEELRSEYIGRLAKQFAGYLERNPGQINLREFYDQLSVVLGARNLMLQGPQIEGDFYEIPAVNEGFHTVILDVDQIENY